VELIHTEIGDLKFDILCSEERLREVLNVNWIYEPEIIYVFYNYVRPGDVCIDAGANLGYHSILLSKLVGDFGKVLAFEPDPPCYRKLIKNIELNKANNVVAIPTALWSERAEYYFFSTHCGFSSFVEYVGQPREKYPMRTFPLDDCIDPMLTIRVLKIDCEGAEERILRGARKLLERGVDCVLVEFNYDLMPICGSGDRQIRDYMHELGYDCYFLYQKGQPPTPLPIEATLGLHSERVHFNMLFTREPPRWSSDTASIQ